MGSPVILMLYACITLIFQWDHFNDFVIVSHIILKVRIFLNAQIFFWSCTYSIRTAHFAR